MTDYRPPVDDILFLLRHVIDTEAVLALPGYAHVDRATVESVIDAVAKFTAGAVAPINLASDRQGARFENGKVYLPDGFVDLYRKWCAAGWPALDLPEEYGGQNMTELVQSALSEMLNGACIAFGMLTTSSRAAARVLQVHADAPTRSIYLPKLTDGEWSGTIVMTEPHAGSDIGLARTKARKLPNGKYAISGTKIFISFADHDAVEQIVHIVLARTEGAPSGVKGLSLFLVPKRTLNDDGSLGTFNNVRIERIEEKMGMHGSPTCVVQFEDAEGMLLDGEFNGIRNMFTMINTMRLEVAFEAIGLSGAATDHALRYALERPQGNSGKGGTKDNDGKPVPIIEHPDVRRMILTMKSLSDAGRALGYEAAWLIDRARAAPDEQTRRDAADLAAWLLPIAKAHLSDNAVDICNIGIQIFGGHGFIKETGAEQYARDARILGIYEGANGIQGIDLVSRKLMQANGRLYNLFVERIRADLGRFAGRKETREIHGAVAACLDLFDRTTQYMVARNRGAPRDALAGASPYLKLAGRLTLGWLWLRMAGVDGHSALIAEKRALAQFYAAQIMADTEALARQATAGAATLDALDSKALARA
ncbi:MAG: acyl-CoA dehydrogenase [Alphaproteobacteria bacterium]